ncbi:MAG: hypothetical protein QM770_01285 [Tepidisphaeraceae bacterium]
MSDIVFTSEFVIDDSTERGNDPGRDESQLYYDARTRGLLAGCRVTLRRGAVDRDSDGAHQLVDVPLFVDLHPLPGCFFDEAILVVTLREHGAVIVGLAPTGDILSPMKYKVTRSAAFRLNTTLLGADFGTSSESEQLMLHSRTRASGIDTNTAMWTLDSLDTDGLPVCNALRMTIRSPASRDIWAMFQLEAEARTQGLFRRVPLIASSLRHDASHLLCHAPNATSTAD